MDKSPRARDTLVNTLELAIENLRQINIMVQDFQPQTQSILNQKVQSIATHLQTLDQLKDCVAKVEIPTEVIDFVDSGRNPLLFNKQRFNAVAKKNAEVRGKIDDYRRFRVHLMDNLQVNFPDVVASYRAMRTRRDENGDDSDSDSDDEDDDENQEENQVDEEAKVAEEEKFEEEEKVDVGVVVVAEEK